MIYQLVHQLQQEEATPVQQSCRILGVSRSGYYEARRRAAKPVVCKVSAHLKAEFHASGQSYGSRRLVTAMANAGFRVARYKVRSLMRQAALKPVWKRKFVHTTNSKHGLPIAPNVLDRQFNPPAPNMAYVSDITYSTPSQRSPPARGGSCLSMFGMQYPGVFFFFSGMPFLCYERK